MQLLITDTVLKRSINFNDVEDMVAAAFDGSQYQNIEKLIDNFEDSV